MCICVCVCIGVYLSHFLYVRDGENIVNHLYCNKKEHVKGSRFHIHFFLHVGVCGYERPSENCFCCIPYVLVRCFHFHLSQDIFSFLFLFLLWPIGCFSFCCFVPLLSHVWVFATPWPAARQAPLSSTTSRSLLQFMSIESVILFNLHMLVNFPVFSL